MSIENIQPTNNYMLVCFEAIANPIKANALLLNYDQPDYVIPDNKARVIKSTNTEHNGKLVYLSNSNGVLVKLENIRTDKVESNGQAHFQNNFTKDSKIYKLLPNACIVGIINE